jgi:microcystin-dependent protein
MSEPFLGEIRMFGGNFAPRGWALCDGQVLAISQNAALFSILGTTYGGNGQTTFALPDMRGRRPVHQGQGPGLSPYVIGQASGAESVTLTQAQLPQHNHVVNALGAGGNQANPTTASYPSGALSGNTKIDIYTTTNPTVTLNPGTIGMTGGNQPVPSLNPYLCVTFIIALQGIFPSRN